MENNPAFEVFSKRFVLASVALSLIVGAASWYLRSLDIPYTENDQIRIYQLEKLERDKGINLLIVGDSAAGNAVDAEQFGVLTGTKALNVALTGSFGIEGSLGMVRQALRLGQPIRYVVIIQTLDIWHRPFSEEGVFDTSQGLEGCVIKEICDNPMSVTKYLLNPKEIFWFFRHLVSPLRPLEVENDYRRQHPDTFMNGKKVLSGDSALSPYVDPGKKEAYRAFDLLCKELGLICVYMHGPLHADVGEASGEALLNVNQVLLGSHSIRVDPSVPLFEGSMMGDTTDHIAPPFKKVTTKVYAEKFLLLTGDSFAQ
jgi:hypothetical protein